MPKKPKQLNSFTGRWRIVSMEQWDQDFVDAEVEGYFEFDDKGWGAFHFGYVHGNMDCRLTKETESLRWNGLGTATTRWTQPKAGVGRSSKAMTCTA